MRLFSIPLRLPAISGMQDWNEMKCLCKGALKMLIYNKMMQVTPKLKIDIKCQIW